MVLYTVLEHQGHYVCNCSHPAVLGECDHVKRQREDDKFLAGGKYVSNLPVVSGPGGAVAPRELLPVPVSMGRGLPTQEEFSMMKAIAQTVHQGGGMVPEWIKSEQQAFGVMLAGYTWGFSPFAAMRQIFQVKGGMELMTQGLIALVRKRDPSARFVFHNYAADGCDVELFRSGEPVIRVSYTPTDVSLSKQGQRPQLDWHKWDTYGPNHPKSGKKYHPFVKVGGVIQYEADPESPWSKFPRDMYAYNAVKRACRLGAPDCLLLVEDQYDPRIVDAEVRYIEARDPAAEPVTELHRALVEGKVSPEAVMGVESAEAVPAAEGVPPENEGVSTGGSEPGRDENGTPDPRVLDMIDRLLADCKATWEATAYGDLYRSIMQEYQLKVIGGKVAYESLTAGRANALLAGLRVRRGEPPEGVEMTTRETETEKTTETIKETEVEEAPKDIAEEPKDPEAKEETSDEAEASDEEGEGSEEDES